MSLSTDTPDLPDSGESKASTDRHSNTLRNGLLGGVVGLVLSVLPFSTVLGGAVAGYLEGGRPAHGASAGSVAGVAALVPPAVGGLGVALLPGVALPTTLPLGVVVAAAVVVAAVYVVGFSVLGGVLGAYARENDLV